jgi:hypothetical protein
MVSKAEERSKAMIPTIFFCATAFFHSAWTYAVEVNVDLPRLNPYWESGMISFLCNSSKYYIIQFYA